MKLPAIKELVAHATLEQLTAAEAALLDGQTPELTIGGDDEGEQLTHVLAAIWVLQHMQETGTDAATALRLYTQRVRQSIN